MRSSERFSGGGVLWAIGEAYYRYSGQEGMGGGDVKMLAMIGAFLGWKLVLVTLVAVVSCGLARRPPGDGDPPRRSEVRAARTDPFLALGGLAASLVGDRLIAWYLTLYPVPITRSSG